MQKTLANHLIRRQSPAAGRVRHVETRFIASHPLGAKPRHRILPPTTGHPGRERRDESRLYAGKIHAGKVCGTFA